MTEPTVRNVIIIGSGPAGLTAGIYAARANLKPLCFEGFNAGGLIPGGQLMFTTEVENYPGFVEGVTGPELMGRFRGQAEKQGCELITQDVDKIDFSEQPFKVWSEGQLYLAKTIILSTGARANYIGLESEEKLKNRGVSACAVCDGPLYRGKAAVVVGGGDTAMEEASYLAGICSSVLLVHRRDDFRASKAMQDRVRANPKIKLALSSAIVEVFDPAENKVTGVAVKDLKTGEVTRHATDALFVAIGHTPMTDLVKEQLELQPNGYVKVQPGTTTTSIPGVFAAGDVADWVYRQAVTAAGTGCMAALEAERWLVANDSAH
ncbi:MAG: thioredoxin-disulfide reductase [Deltaproteobacteria bacterium]|nr:thioredoxin-disulfide reductase [Deltaproteobacteria bacterium]